MPPHLTWISAQASLPGRAHTDEPNLAMLELGLACCQDLCSRQVKRGVLDRKAALVSGDWCGNARVSGRKRHQGQRDRHLTCSPIYLV